MNTSRGESSFSGSSGNGIRMYAPHLPMNLGNEQLQNGTGHSNSFRTVTPDQALLTVPTSSEEERETTEARRRRGRPSLINSVSNLQSSCPSPDEIVIKGRGRRSLPLKWSPIPIESPQKAPVMSPIARSSKKGLIALRSSPRKRLQLNDASTNDLFYSRKALLSSSPLARKSIESETEAHSKHRSDKHVNDLSKDQLVHVLNTIIEKHPQLKEEVKTMLDVKSPESPNTNDFEVLNHTN